MIDNTSALIMSHNIRSLNISRNADFFRIFSLYEKDLVYLSVLDMSFCNVLEIPSDFFLSMRNILYLDMRYNNLQMIKQEMFIYLHRLRTLLLDGNNEIYSIESRAFVGLLSLEQFELSRVSINYISKDAFQSLTVTTFALSQCTIDSADNEAFNGLSVSNMYLNDTKIHFFQDDIFKGLEITHNLVTSAFKFCCIRPANFPEENCYPRQDEFSSCSDLMRNSVLRSLLWVIGLFSLLGNAASLMYRFVYDRQRLTLGYGIFVTNLAIADFLMGMYLIIVASVDLAFRGIYFYHDESWRSSFWCKMAGVLSTVSSEASVLFICLITLDRILVTKYPFGQIRFTTKSSICVSCLVWLIVGLIGILPVMIKSYFKGTFYSKTGVCLGLPLTRDRPPGWAYSIGVFIVFNFLIFMAVAFGQWLIYKTINSTKERVKAFSTARATDLRVARNLLLVAMTDFLCWFPVGVIGKWWLVILMSITPLHEIV